MFRTTAVALCLAASCAACKDAERKRLEQTTIPTYDTTTGKLTELTYDQNKNGRVDTWTQTDGARPVSSRQDLDEDGKPERWEYYDADGKVAKVGFSRRENGRPDAWAYPGADGRFARIEVSSAGDEKKIDRWETYSGDAIVKAEEDTNGDGRGDKWELHEAGVLKSVSFDENFDGAADRRLTYDLTGNVVLIETVPDGSGGYRNRMKITGQEGR